MRAVFPLYDDNPHRRTPYVVLAFIAVNLVVWCYEFWWLGARPAVEQFAQEWGLVPARLWREWDKPAFWWTIGSSMFLHGSWTHVLGNCWFLWLFGNNIEDRLGHVRFVIFYALSGVGAAAMQTAFEPFSVRAMIGASGAISGVLGAYMRYFPKAPIYSLVPLWFAPILPVPAFVFMIAWFAFQIWQGVGSRLGLLQDAGIAWWAHIGGFAAGFALARPMRPGGRRRSR